MDEGNFMPVDGTPTSRPADNIRRILSIDGGGIKGVFPAAFLAEIEDRVGGSVADYFDLIAGTSTGGIIALGLGLGFSAREILSFYEQNGAEVFRGRRFQRVRSLFGPRYDSEPLRRALNVHFGERRLGESRKRLVIPSMSLATGDVYIYKTPHHPRFERDYTERVVDVAMATASAPVYFPAHRSATGIPLVDGGMWANNPTGMAVVEAIGTLGWPAGSLRVLSLGCTTPPFSLGRGRLEAFGLGQWALKLVDTFMAGQSSGSMGIAYVLLGHDRVKRISPTVAAGRFSLDGVKEIPALRSLASETARYQLPLLRPTFFDSRAEDFVPHHLLAA
jgi:hypothetical protein